MIGVNSRFCALTAGSTAQRQVVEKMTGAACISGDQGGREHGFTSTERPVVVTVQRPELRGTMWPVRAHLGPVTDTVLRTVTVVSRDTISPAITYVKLKEHLVMTWSLAGREVDERYRCVYTVKKTGERCRVAALRGGTLCHFHGGTGFTKLVEAGRRELEQHVLEHLRWLGHSV